MSAMEHSILIVGAGIAGLAAAVACGSSRSGRSPGPALQVIEQSGHLGEIGAGVQLGPNATAVLHGWGLHKALAEVAAFPALLEVRSAVNAQGLGRLPLGDRAHARYGAPYATIARQDLHALLHQAVIAQGAVDMTLNARVERVDVVDQKVRVLADSGRQWEVDGVLGADGIWSVMRQAVAGNDAPRLTGHVAFRSMVRQSALPQALRSQVVTAWLGPQFHAVQYPVCGGEWLNVVVIVRSGPSLDPNRWDQAATVADLRARMAGACIPLRDLVWAIDDWTWWALSDRAPLRRPADMVRGRVALLGDAAHPMRPYLAQGAGMALEDAAQISHSLYEHPEDLVAGLAHYAARRWKRNARVQARAIRNGQVFHLRGLARWARDTSIRLGGARVLDVPWLYEYRVG